MPHKCLLFEWSKRETTENIAMNTFMLRFYISSFATYNNEIQNFTNLSKT